MAETALAEVPREAAVVPLQTKLTPAAEARGITPEAWHVMKTVLFKGASDEMVCTLVDYCKARGLDPLKKPFHIVPVWDAKENRMVDTIWPSIGETRITAMRTKQYAGISEIKHGETVSRKIGKTQLEYPEWAQCSVFRMIDGQPREFVGPRVYWLETYARKGRDLDPNAMWARRPFGQLDKCAEAAALRAAFPEEGSGPTAEEMDGQTINGEVHQINPAAEKSGNAHLGQFSTGTPEASGVIEAEVSLVEVEPPAPETEAETKPEPEGKPAAGGVTLWVSADEKAKPFKDIPAAVFELRRLIKSAKTPALAKATFDNNFGVIGQLSKKDGEAIEKILDRRFEQEGASGTLV